MQRKEKKQKKKKNVPLKKVLIVSIKFEKGMAMSQLYNKIAQKPAKKNQEQLLTMPYSQTWMNNGKSNCIQRK